MVTPEGRRLFMTTSRIFFWVAWKCLKHLVVFSYKRPRSVPGRWTCQRTLEEGFSGSGEGSCSSREGSSEGNRPLLSWPGQHNFSTRILSLAIRWTNWIYCMYAAALLHTDRLKNELVICCEVKDWATGTRVAQLPKTLVTERYLVRQKIYCKKMISRHFKRDIRQILYLPTMNLAGGIPKRSRKYLIKSWVSDNNKNMDTWMPQERKFWR